jgi:hypothetical protein
MIAATEDDLDEYASPSVLSGIKEKLIITDLINQLDIADGLKEFLLPPMNNVVICGITNNQCAFYMFYVNE